MGKITVVIGQNQVKLPEKSLFLSIKIYCLLFKQKTLKNSNKTLLLFINKFTLIFIKITIKKLIKPFNIL